MKIIDSIKQLKRLNIDARIFLFFSLVLGLIITNNPLSIITLILIFIPFLFVINFIFFKFDYKQLLLYFFIFFSISIFIYVAQKISLKGHYGFSGDGAVIGGGIGTDDSYFYSIAVGKKNLPDNFPLRTTFGLYKISAYSQCLSIFSKIITFFYKIHPIDLLMLNVIVMSFLPFITQKIVNIIFSDKKIEKYSFYITAFCPFLMANGLILVRDGFTAFLFMGSLLFFINKKYFKFFLFFLLLTWIRTSSGLMAVVFYITFILLSGKEIIKNKKVTFGLGILILIVAGTIGRNYFMWYITNKLGTNLFFRQDFLEEFISDNGAFSKIYSLPIFLRLPVSFIYFLIMPLPRFDVVIVRNIFVIRNVLFGTFGFLSLYYFYHFFKLNFLIIIKKIKDRKITQLIVSFSIVLLILSQISMQSRHKTMIYPIYYIIISYSLAKSKNTYITLSAKVAIIGVEILLVLLNLYLIAK